MIRKYFFIHYRGTKYSGTKQKVAGILEAMSKEAERNKDYSAMHDILQHLHFFQKID